MKMRKMTGMLVFGFAGLTAFGQKKEATVTVNIAPLKADTIIMVEGSEVTYAKPDGNGTCTFHFKQEFPKSVSVSIERPKRGRVMLFLEEGDHLNVTTTFDKAPVFTGKGANNAKVYDEIFTRIANAWHAIDDSIVKAGTPNDLNKTFHRMFRPGFDILNASKKSVTPSFYKSEYAFLYYQNLGYALDVPFWYGRITRKRFSESIPDDYKSLEKQIKFDDKLLGTESYQSFMFSSLPGYYENLYKLNSGMPDSTFSDEELFLSRYRGIEKGYTGKTRTTALKNELGGKLQAVKDATALKPLLDEYVQKYSGADNAENIKSLQEIYNTTARLAIGQTPAPFVLKDIDGRQVTLKDFAGKVVYMDFWASWCAPCRAQMREGAPRLHKLFETNKDIVFLYINMDERMDLAKKAIAEDKIEGTHVFSGGFQRDNATMKAFNISGIPRYVIIGKDGKIFDNDAPRPTEEITPKRLEEALKGAWVIE